MRAYHILGLLFLVLIGCESSDQTAEPLADGSYDQATSQQAEVLTALESMDQEVMQQAFSDLSRIAFTTDTRTEQLDASGQVIATMRQTARHIGQDTTQVLDTQATGSFDFGWLDRFMSEDINTPSFASLPTYTLPEDPPYLSPRNREAFLYSFLPDTVIAGTPVRVMEVRALTEAGEDQTIRHARFFITPEDNTLLQLSLSHLEKGLLFREESRFELALRPALDSTNWLPAYIRSDVKLNVPLRPTERFLSATTFSDFAATV
jgi:hypothetical protein